MLNQTDRKQCDWLKRFVLILSLTVLAIAAAALLANLRAGQPIRI